MAIQAHRLSHEPFDTVAFVGFADLLFHRNQEPGLDAASGQGLAVEIAQPPVMPFAEYPVDIDS